MNTLTIALSSLALIAACGLASAGEDSDASPNASETAWIAKCLAANGEQKAAYDACVGIVTGACLGVENAPKSISPSDKFSHPRSCAPVEDKIWDSYLNRWYAEAAKSAPAEAKPKLRDAQRAWIAYRSARCAVESALNPFPLGEDNHATCLMEETARRALEIREIASQN